MFPRGHEKRAWRREGDFQPPSLEEVQRWLTPWLAGCAIRDIKLMDGGLMNRNCRIQLSRSPDVVLRLYDRDPASAAKELAILQRLRRGLPVPEVLYARADARDGDPPFLVLEWIDGVSLRELRRSGDADAIAGAAHEAGRLLARLQPHRFDRAGLLTSTLAIDTVPPPERLTTTTLVEHFARLASFRARVGTTRLDDLRRVARDWDEHPRAPAMDATLVHGDFNSRNILVRKDRGRWRVSAILDWESAFAGPAYCDIGSFLRYERDDRPRFEPSFSRGLRDGGIRLEGDWRQAARMADLPALCDVLACESIPDDVATEVLELVSATAAQA